MRRKIYIADDEINIRTLLKAFLEKSGHNVTDFENGDLLLAAFNESPADMVVLDVMMPGSNGFVICKELRKISTVPIIMLTARDSDLDYSTGLDLGSDDYLIKPFSPMALVKRIEAIFRRVEFERVAHTKNNEPVVNEKKYDSLSELEETLEKGFFISKRLVMIMGGSISVESEPGKGGTFTFTLPYKIGDAKEQDNCVSGITDSPNMSSIEPGCYSGRTLMQKEDDNRVKSLC